MAAVPRDASRRHRAGPFIPKSNTFIKSAGNRSRIAIRKPQKLLKIMFRLAQPPVNFSFEDEKQAGFTGNRPGAASWTPSVLKKSYTSLHSTVQSSNENALERKQRLNENGTIAWSWRSEGTTSKGLCLAVEGGAEGAIGRP
jgi:hypothetical protein